MQDLIENAAISSYRPRKPVLQSSGAIMNAIRNR